MHYACSLVFLVWALWHGLDDPTYVRSLGVAIWSYLHPSISTALMRPRRPKQYCLQLVIYIYIYITYRAISVVFNVWSTVLKAKVLILACVTVPYVWVFLAGGGGGSREQGAKDSWTQARGSFQVLIGICCVSRITSRAKWWNFQTGLPIRSPASVTK